MANPRGSNSHFATVPSVNRPRSVFDRSHTHKTTFDAGYLVPVYVDEALPGDTFNVHMTAFARLATPIHPIMDNMYLTSFFFAVPLRLIWDKFQRFMGEQPNPDDSTDFVTPKVTVPAGTGFDVGSLYDYFGIPTGIPSMVGINNFPARAYNRVWNDWFRDENLQDSVTVDVDEGPDDPAAYVLLRRGKRHDYFTSALPWPQKGPAVALPLTGDAPVIGNGTVLGLTDGTTNFGLTPNTQTVANTGVFGTAVGTANSGANVTSNLGAGVVTDPADSGLIADLGAVTAATINQLREAITIQQLYETDARGGTRYTEIILAHFGVVSPDARLQRPEYLGGATSFVNITAIAQQSETSAESPQANLAAIGTATMKGSHGFTKSFTEHSIILGLVCAHADLTYQQGINRMHLRSTRFDFYWPTLANLGEQVVYNKEIYAVGSANLPQDEAAFGYQERWAEYRYKPSMITGQFRSTFATSLDFWHLAQEFSALPELGATFIQEDPPVDRVIAVTSEPHFLFDSSIRMRTVRPMPVYSVPGLRRL